MKIKSSSIKLVLIFFMASSLLLTATYTNSNAIAQLKASGPETPPIAIAGPEQAAVAGTTATLDGTGSFDADGDRIVKYNWSESGPGMQVAISNKTSPAPSFEAPIVKTPTDLTFSLTVNDGKHDSIPDHTVVHIIPKGATSTLTSQNTIASNLNNTTNANSTRTATTLRPIPPLQSVSPQNNNVTTTKTVQLQSNNTNPESNATVAQLIPFLPEQQQQQQQTQPTSPPQVSTEGFMAKGTINSLIYTPRTKWIATGNWSMNINNGTLTSFGTNMTWFNNNGTSSHTHEFQNLKSSGAKTITVQQPSDNVILKGVMDIGTNHRIIWKNVPTTINISGGKTITISVNDKYTNKHFAGQPILGVVTSLTRCSDVPGPNMEVLPSCSFP
jgi:hypothetical protein